MLRRLLPLLGVNAVPVVGVFHAGWSPATALALYWWENLIGSLLVAVRIAVHRAATGKRGHRRHQLGLETGSGASRGERRGQADRGARGPARQGAPRQGSFLAEFLVAACAASLLHGGLLWFLLRGTLGEGPEADSLRRGVLAVAAFQLAGLALDLTGIRRRPFAWIRDVAQAAVGRVTLIHVALIAGFWFGLTSGNLSFFGPFVVLKLLADVGNLAARLGVNLDSEEAPGWLASAMNRLRPDGGDFAEHWREEREERRRLWEQDEQVAG